MGRHLAAVERLLDKLEPLLWDERVAIHNFVIGTVAWRC